MSNLNRNETVLIHMQRYCNEINEAFEEYGKDFELFQSNSIYRNAISMSIFQIGELSNHLTDEYREETTSEINWKQIRSMRNHFAHGYGDMNLNIIYETALYDIPDLEDFIKKELKRFNKEQQDDLDIY